jgi:bifunctional DNA-binding transcriptional regulator/antitoxin component of YhaV-PrlF toxin-antitoxin module
MASEVKKTAGEAKGQAAGDADGAMSGVKSEAKGPKGEAGGARGETKGATRRSAGRSRISSKHQITIPIGAFSEAGLREGDIVQVKAQGPGRVVIARMDDLLDEYAGCLSTGGELGRAVRGMGQEWG